MLIEETHIANIKEAFAQMQTKEDFLNLLNYTAPIIFGDKTYEYKLQQITWYANPIVNTKRYKTFSIKKKSGSERLIHAPVKGLKSIQKTLSFILQCVFEPHKAAYGFVRNKSIVDNAKVHVGSNYIYNIDLKDFFPSIDQARVWKCLQLKPFNLFDSTDPYTEDRLIVNSSIKRFSTEFNETIFYKIVNNRVNLIYDRRDNLRRYKSRITGHLIMPKIDSKGLNIKKYSLYKNELNKLLLDDAKKYILAPEKIIGFAQYIPSRKSISNLIAALCCTDMEVERKSEDGEWEKVQRNVLPQGAPTSPVITNIICQRLDYLLSGVAKRFGLKYSRYADDITFSSMHNVYQPESDFLKELNRIIGEQNFHIKESKTRLQKDGYRKEVTGLLVNEKANVQQRYIKQLRMYLYYWERYGYERASHLFLQQYITDKGHVKKDQPEFKKVISGKLDYLKMVKGGDNELYQKLAHRYGLLINSNKQISKPENRSKQLNTILSLLLSDGIEFAMKKYNQL